MDNVTTTKDLIIKIHKLFVDNKDKIPSVVTFKKGVLPPLPAFPALAILPIEETFNYNYSGGRYKVNRKMELQVITKTVNKRDGRDQVEDLIDKCNRILRDNPTIEDQCFDCIVSVQDLGDPIERDNSLLTFGVITLSCLSFEDKPERRESVIELYETKSNHLVSQIYDQFIKYKNDQDYPLNSISTLHVQTLGPQPAFPVVIISDMGCDRIRQFTGIDMPSREIRIEVITKLLDKDFALFQNLDICENIKRVLQMDYTLGGAAINSEVERINYFRNKDESLGLLYDSIFTFTCQTLEYLRDEEVMNEKDKKSW